MSEAAGALGHYSVGNVYLNVMRDTVLVVLRTPDDYNGTADHLAVSVDGYISVERFSVIKLPEEMLLFEEPKGIKG